MKKLPKYFAIKRDAGNQLWEKYVQWLRDRYDSPYYGDTAKCFYGLDSNNNVEFHRKISKFGYQAIALTLEEWDECVNGFVLPEKWYIMITDENRSAIDDWKMTTNWKESLRKHNYSAVSNEGSGWMHMGRLNYHTEITFEQFKQHVLKQDDMKIIGYKLKPSCEKHREAAKVIKRSHNGKDSDHLNGLTDFFGLSDNGIPTRDAFREAGVLDLWFDEVYEEEFKVGDWVVRTNESGGMHSKGRVLKISAIIGRDSFKAEQDESGDHMFSSVRKATPEEIESAQVSLPKINGYDGKYIQDLNGSKIQYGCAKFWVSELRYILEFGKDLGKTIGSITLDSGVNINRTQIKQILKYVDAQ